MAKIPTPGAQYVLSHVELLTKKVDSDLEFEKVAAINRDRKMSTLHKHNTDKLCLMEEVSLSAEMNRALQSLANLV